MGWPKNPRYLGKPVPRVDGPAKVSGRAKYSADIVLPGMLYAAFYRSRWPAAWIASIGLDKVRAAPGIKAAVAMSEPPFAVKFYGQELAVIAGTSRQAVEDALPLVEVNAQPRAFAAREVDAISEGAPRLFEDHPNLYASEKSETGDVDAAFANCAAIVEGTFSTPVLIHHPMESFGGVASTGDDGLTAWMSTQGVFGLRKSLAAALGLSQSKVRVVCDHMGGGFGAKTSPGLEPATAARMAQRTGAPVRLLITHFEASLASGNRPSSHQRIKLGANRDGTLLAFQMHAFGTAGFTTGAATEGGSASAKIPMPYIYTVPNTRVLQANLTVNAGIARPMRAPAHPQASFGMESIMDELAVKLGMDPVELRLKNDPFAIRRREYEIGSVRFGWKEKYRPPGSSPGPVKVGIGCAGATWGGGGSGTQAELQINPDGTVEVRCGSQDLGTGTRTVAAMVAAEMLHLDLAQVDARVGDTRLPPSGASGGSTQTASVAPAVYDACESAVAELRQASGIDDPLGARWDEACRKMGPRPIIVHGRWRPGLSTSGAGGVQFAEVEVDTETGFVKVRKILAVQDCGLVVNRLTCASQVNGGVIMGLGYALYEGRVMDRLSGVMLNSNLETYKLPGPTEIPEIDVVLLDMPERGVIGVAEPATIPTAAAIANAVANAIGRRIPSLPLTPDKVLAAVGRLPPGSADPGGLAPGLEAGFAAIGHAPAASPANAEALA